MLLKHKFTTLSAVLCFSALLAWCSQPWKSGDSKNWTEQDAQQVLEASPWAETVGATFSLAQEDAPEPPPIDAPQAGLPNPRDAATDGRWDGGIARVKRDGPPTLNVTVQWESALPVRQALEQKHTPSLLSAEQIRRDYVISVFGLVRSGSGTPEMLENVMRYSRLYPRTRSPITPEDAKVDGSSGTLRLFFPRSAEINLRDKEVLFETRFGSLSVTKKFRLKDMLYGRRLEL